MNLHLTHDLSVAFEHLAREGILHSLSYQRVSGPFGRERELAIAAGRVRRAARDRVQLRRGDRPRDRARPHGAVGETMSYMFEARHAYFETWKVGDSDRKYFDGPSLADQSRMDEVTFKEPEWHATMNGRTSYVSFHRTEREALAALRASLHEVLDAMEKRLAQLDKP